LGGSKKIKGLKEKFRIKLHMYLLLAG
jgi:hypothetical protein